jgi:hypothetical protein
LSAFFHGASYVLILAKHGLGYTLGDFSTNSSGLPDKGQQEDVRVLIASACISNVSGSGQRKNGIKDL